MTHVESNLISGEKIIYRAHIHWFVFLPSIILAAMALLLVAINNSGEGGANIGVLMLYFAVILLIRALIIKVSSELTVTSKRVIAKVGFIRRRTIELNHSKVESFKVNQGIFGKMLNYGTIIVRGTGGGRTGISGIDSPLDFRGNAMETIDQSQEPSCSGPIN